MAILYTDPRFIDHDTGPGHPECPARLKHVYARLDASGLQQRFEKGVVRAATPEELALVHKPSYIKHVEAFARKGGGNIDSDTVVCPKSYDIARLAAGTAIAAVEQVLKSERRQAVCLFRPPGHHALPGSAMGFCLFGNVSIAAAAARELFDVERVLIVDWDVHHGNGTQEAFYRDGNVYFFSAHRYPFYPGTGATNETGMGLGLGTIFNLPLEFGVSRADYLTQFQTVLEQVASRCRPDLVLVSAGFDAHRADPIGSLGLETEDFADLTSLVMDVAKQYCEGRLVSVLEGGYNLEKLADSVQCHLETLLAESEK